MQDIILDTGYFYVRLLTKEEKGDTDKNYGVFNWAYGTCDTKTDGEVTARILCDQMQATKEALLEEAEKEEKHPQLKLVEEEVTH